MRVARLAHRAVAGKQSVPVGSLLGRGFLFTEARPRAHRIISTPTGSLNHSLSPFGTSSLHATILPDSQPNETQPENPASASPTQETTSQSSEPNFSSANPENLPVPSATGPSSPSALATSTVPINPFDTHRFFQSLERAFPAPVARTLMKATRAILVDRIRRTKGEALDVKDFDNGAYLFRAALSELRTELTMRTRKDSASLRTTTAGLRKEVDILEAKMKEDIATLKHDIQIDTNNRKAETRVETKASELAIETMYHRTIVTLGDLRTEIEQLKWHNTRIGVAVILSFVAFVIAAMELAPKPPPPRPPPPTTIIQQAPLPDIRELEDEAQD